MVGKTTLGNGLANPLTKFAATFENGRFEGPNPLKRFGHQRGGSGEAAICLGKQPAHVQGQSPWSATSGVDALQHTTKSDMIGLADKVLEFIVRRHYDVFFWQNIEQAYHAGIQEGRHLPVLNDASISCARLRDYSRHLYVDSVLLIDAYNTQIRAEYCTILENTLPISPSIFTFFDWTFGGSESILLSDQQNACLIGDAVGWGIDFAKWFLEQTYDARWLEDNSGFSIEENRFSSCKVSNLGISMSAPGQNIYGHWLLDYVPRLYAMRNYVTPFDTVTINYVPTWSETFLDAFKVKFKTGGLEDSKQLRTAGQAQVPGFLKRGYVIDRLTCREAWSYLAEHFARSSSAYPEKIDKIFVTRRKSTLARPIFNERDLEDVAEKRGYQVVAPEMMRIEEQASLFRSARLIVGQDGSALHNIVFSNPGAVLGVITLPARCNMWHISICEALGHKIAYIETEQHDGADILSCRRFDEFLEKIESAIQI